METFSREEVKVGYFLMTLSVNCEENNQCHHQTQSENIDIRSVFQYERLFTTKYSLVPLCLQCVAAFL